MSKQVFKIREGELEALQDYYCERYEVTDSEEDREAIAVVEMLMYWTRDTTEEKGKERA